VFEPLDAQRALVVGGVALHQSLVAHVHAARVRAAPRAGGGVTGEEVRRVVGGGGNAGGVRSPGTAAGYRVIGHLLHTKIRPVTEKDSAMFTGGKERPRPRQEG